MARAVDFNRTRHELRRILADDLERDPAAGGVRLDAGRDDHDLRPRVALRHGHSHRTIRLTLPVLPSRRLRAADVRTVDPDLEIGRGVAEGTRLAAHVEADLVALRRDHRHLAGELRIRIGDRQPADRDLIVVPDGYRNLVESLGDSGDAVGGEVQLEDHGLHRIVEFVVDQDEGNLLVVLVAVSPLDRGVPSPDDAPVLGLDRRLVEQQPDRSGDLAGGPADARKRDRHEATALTAGLLAHRRRRRGEADRARLPDAALDRVRTGRIRKRQFQIARLGRAVQMVGVLDRHQLVRAQILRQALDPVHLAHGELDRHGPRPLRERPRLLVVSRRDHRDSRHRVGSRRLLGRREGRERTARGGRIGLDGRENRRPLVNRGNRHAVLEIALDRLQLNALRTVVLQQMDDDRRRLVTLEGGLDAEIALEVDLDHVDRIVGVQRPRERRRALRRNRKRRRRPVSVLLLRRIRLGEVDELLQALHRRRHVEHPDRLPVGVNLRPGLRPGQAAGDGAVLAEQEERRIPGPVLIRQAPGVVAERVVALEDPLRLVDIDHVARHVRRAGIKPPAGRVGHPRGIPQQSRRQTVWLVRIDVLPADILAMRVVKHHQRHSGGEVLEILRIEDLSLETLAMGAPKRTREQHQSAVPRRETVGRRVEIHRPFAERGPLPARIGSRNRKRCDHRDTRRVLHFLPRRIVDVQDDSRADSPGGLDREADAAGILKLDPLDLHLLDDVPVHRRLDGVGLGKADVIRPRQRNVHIRRLPVLDLKPRIRHDRERDARILVHREVLEIALDLLDDLGRIGLLLIVEDGIGPDEGIAIRMVIDTLALPVKRDKGESFNKVGLPRPGTSRPVETLAVLLIGIAAFTTRHVAEHNL